MIKKHTTFIFFSMLLVVSCKTTGSGNNIVDISGMIYDFSNRPIPYCDVFLGDNYNSSTDINGRFTLPKVQTGNYEITASKKGFEIYADQILINDKRQIIYIRIPSQNQLLELADEALTSSDFTAAEEIMERAYQIDQNNIEMLFYYAALAFRKQEYDRAIDFLESAVSLGSRDIYVESFLNELKSMRNNE